MCDSKILNELMVEARQYMPPIATEVFVHRKVLQPDELSRFDNYKFGFSTGLMGRCKNEFLLTFSGSNILYADKRESKFMFSTKFPSNYGVEVDQIRGFIISEEEDGTSLMQNKPGIIFKKSFETLGAGDTRQTYYNENAQYRAGIPQVVIIWIYLHEVEDNRGGDGSGADPLPAITLDPNGKYFKSKKFSDLIVSVGTQKFPAHRFVLAGKSPVFDAMLDSDMVESKVRILKIEDFENSVVEEFFQFIYTGTCQSLFGTGGNVDIILQLLRMAHKYDVESMTLRCEYLLKKKLDIQNVIQIFATAEFLGFKSLEKFSMSFFWDHRKSIISSDKVLEKLWKEHTSKTIYKLFGFE